MSLSSLTKSNALPTYNNVPKTKFSCLRSVLVVTLLSQNPSKGYTFGLGVSLVQINTFHPTVHLLKQVVLLRRSCLLILLIGFIVVTLTSSYYPLSHLGVEISFRTSPNFRLNLQKNISDLVLWASPQKKHMGFSTFREKKMGQWFGKPPRCKILLPFFDCFYHVIRYLTQVLGNFRTRLS